MKEYVAGIVRRKFSGVTKFLMLYHNAINRWVFPGGKPEPGEDLEAALMRELIEEIGVAPILNRFHSSYVHEVKGVDWTGWFFVVYLNGLHEPVLQEPDQHGGMRWLTLAEMKELPVAEQELFIAKELTADELTR